MFFFHFHAEQLAQRHCFGKCLASMFPFPLLLSILISVNAFGSSLGQQEDIEEGELCHPPFGCFPNTADFVHSIFRPVNLHPEAPAAVDTHFYFYAKWLSTNATDDNLCGGGGGDHLRPAFDVHYQPCVFTTADLLDKEKFDRKLKRLAIDKQQSSTPAAAAGVGQQWTAFVVHGFLDNLSENSWMTRMKDRLLRLVDNAEVAEGGRTGGRRHYESVVLVDWQGGNHIPYLQATANTRLVGAQIAFLARRLHVISIPSLSIFVFISVISTLYTNHRVLFIILSLSLSCLLFPLPFSPPQSTPCTWTSHARTSSAIASGHTSQAMLASG